MEPVEYRLKAAEIDAEAKKAKATPSLAHELENLANAYLRLAEQAERNTSWTSFTSRHSWKGD